MSTTIPLAIIDAFIHSVHQSDPSLRFALGKYSTVLDKEAPSVITTGFLEEFANLYEQELTATLNEVNQTNVENFLRRYHELKLTDGRQPEKSAFPLTLRDALNAKNTQYNLQRSGGRFLFWLTLYHYPNESESLVSELFDLFDVQGDLMKGRTDALSKIAFILENIPQGWSEQSCLVDEQTIKNKLVEQFNAGIKHKEDDLTFSDIEGFINHDTIKGICSLIRNIFYLEHPKEISRLLKIRYLMRSITLAHLLFTIHYPFIFRQSENQTLKSLFVYGGMPPGSISIDASSISPEGLSILSAKEYLNSYFEIVKEIIEEKFQGKSIENLYFFKRDNDSNIELQDNFTKNHQPSLIFKNNKKTGIILCIDEKPKIKSLIIKKSDTDIEHNFLEGFEDKGYPVEDLLYASVYGNSLLGVVPRNRAVTKTLWRLLGLAGLKNIGRSQRIAIEGYALSGIVASFIGKERITDFGSFVQSLSRLGLVLDYDTQMLELFQKYSSGSESTFHELCDKNSSLFLERLLNSDFARTSSDSHAEVFCHD